MVFNTDRNGLNRKFNAAATSSLMVNRSPMMPRAYVLRYA